MMVNKEIQKVLDKNGLKKKSKFIIEVDTKFNNFKGKDLSDDYDKDEDWTKEIENNFHQSTHKIIQEYIEDGEDFCNLVLEEMGDSDNLLPKKVKEFGDLGEISIRMYSEENKDGSVFDNWKNSIKERVLKCKTMEELKKALSDELYGVEEYLEELRK